MTNAEKFFEKIKNKKDAFIGIGVSHTDVIRQFAEKGIAPKQGIKPTGKSSAKPPNFLKNPAQC